MKDYCPRCKERTLNRNDCGESALYQSQHLICISCWFDEDLEIQEAGTNNIPETLERYGAPNDWG